MAVCCCSLAGTAACQHCRNNPMATDVWTNIGMVMTDHAEVKPLGSDLGGCLVCGKPSAVNKSITNADRIRSMSDEELAELIGDNIDCSICKKEFFRSETCPGSIVNEMNDCYAVWLDWLKQECAE